MLVWLLAGVVLHVAAQVCRGVAWSAVLSASWPQASRPRVCAWHICGAGLSGVLSARGGDAVRIALGRRELPGASCAALAGSLVVEGAFATLSGLAIGAAALAIGLSAIKTPAPEVGGAVLGACALVALLAWRVARVRRFVADLARGAAILRDPRRFARSVLPWEVAGRGLHIAAVGCLLLAAGLPAAPAVIVAACAAQGSGGAIPVPGAGFATNAAALAVVLPLAAGQPVDAGAIATLVLLQSVVLTAVGVTLSVVVLGSLVGARTPRAWLRAAQALVPAPAPARSGG